MNESEITFKNYGVTFEGITLLDAEEVQMAIYEIQSNFQAKIAELELKSCTLDLTKGHLSQCEAALESRDKRIAELENIPTHVFTRRPFRPRIDTPEKQESYTKGFEDALKEVQSNIDKNKGGAE